VVILNHGININGELLKDNIVELLPEKPFSYTNKKASEGRWYYEYTHLSGTNGHLFGYEFGEKYIYAYDTFGIQSLMRDNRVTFKNVPGIKHYDWLHNHWDIFTTIIFLLFD